MPELRSHALRLPKNGDGELAGVIRSMMPLAQVDDSVPQPQSARNIGALKPGSSERRGKPCEDKAKTGMLGNEDLARNGKDQPMPNLASASYSKYSQHKLPSEYPRFVVFSKHVSEYSTHLADKFSSEVVNARRIVDKGYLEAQEVTSQQLEEYSRLRGTLDISLGKELLLLTRHKGKSTEIKTSVTLDERMRRFTRVLNTESDRLLQLQRQLRETNEQLKALGESVCSNSGEFEEDPGSQLKDTDYLPAVLELRVAYGNRKQDCLAKFVADTEELQGRLIAAEGHHLRRCQNAKSRFQQLVQTTMDQNSESIG